MALTENARARTAIRSARLLLEAGDEEGATNRAYYAMFHAARDYLNRRHAIAPGEIRTHNGVIARFGQLAVLRDGLPAEIGRALNSVQERRSVIDYDTGERYDELIGEAAVTVDRAEHFVVTVLNAVETQ